MESISSRNLPLVLHTLSQIELAIDRLQERTKNIRSVDDFLSTPGGMEKLDADVVFEVISKELDPLKKAISFFKEQLLD